MMARISLALNIVLLLAVGYLFWDRLRSHGREDDAISPAEPVASAFSDTSGVRPPIVAFVSGDSINARYAYIVEKTATLEQGMKTADRKLRDEYAKRQKEVDELIQYAQGKELPEDEQMVIQQRLTQLEQEMAAMEERETGALMKKEEQLQKDLQKRVSRFLDEYARQKGIDYVLNYQEGVQLVLHGNPAYDVTREVLDGLNREYEQEKANGK